jgi:hypothetical protein
MASERCRIQQPRVSFGLTSRRLPPAPGQNSQNRGEIPASIPEAAVAKAASLSTNIVGTVSGSQCPDNISDAPAELVSHTIARHIELWVCQWGRSSTTVIGGRRQRRGGRCTDFGRNRE